MSAKLTALAQFAGGQIPTDLMYIVDVSAGAGGSLSSTLNDLFSIITRNITDGAVRFQGFVPPAVSGAGQGAIYYDSADNRFKVSENAGAYANLGNVNGPALATDNAIVRFDLATGKLIQNSVVTIADATGDILGVGTLNTHTIPAVAADTFALLNAVQAFTNKTITNANNVLGGVTMTLGADGVGDIYYRNAGGLLTRLGIGGAAQVLTVNAGLPSWQNSAAVTTPGGLNTQVQYNNAGAFGGITGFTSDGTRVTVSQNPLFNVGAGALDNLIYVNSGVAGAVDASFGFFVAGLGSSTANDGPYFLARGNTYNANSDQRGSFLFTAGNPIGPTGNQGTIRFFTGNEVERMQIMRDGTIQFLGPESYFGNGVTNAAPADYILNATGGSGTDIAGAHLDLAGGKGTGNAVPGLVAVRYPLVGASGTTLQSLSASRFPVVTNMFVNSTFVLLSNSTTETSLFAAGVTGATRTIEAGMARVGQIYQIRIDGTFTTTASPTMRLRAKLGSTTIADTTALTLAPANGTFTIDVNIQIGAIGAVGSVTVQSMFFQYISGSPGTGNVQGFTAPALVTSPIDFTAAQVIDVTAQWGTANANNIFVATPQIINIIR